MFPRLPSARPLAATSPSSSITSRFSLCKVDDNSSTQFNCLTRKNNKQTKNERKKNFLLVIFNSFLQTFSHIIRIFARILVTNSTSLFAFCVVNVSQIIKRSSLAQLKNQNNINTLFNKFFVHFCLQLIISFIKINNSIQIPCRQFLAIFQGVSCNKQRPHQICP